MKLTVLCDNNTIIDLYLTGEPALSFFIEDCGKNILFDTGYSDVFIKNAEELGISLLSVDYIVFSHNHNDHTGGFVFLKEMYENAAAAGISCKRPVIIAHPEIFRKTTLEGFGDIGSPLTEEEVITFADIMLSCDPVEITENITFIGEITENITFIGEITEKVSFEPPCDIGVYKDSAGNLVPDYQDDDTALFYSGENGLVVITGCSHKGICSIVKQAVKISGRSDLQDIIGGFHLLGADQKRLESTGEYFAGFAMKCIHPCHCTDLSAKIALAGYVPVEEIGSGSVLEY
ncbi:MBL fold metallo-hydrolase [Methanoplanus endosymbiosus]|uniref:MBL fold metallo-hydrolase n=1 Tax=Methanoplanus endosymbiosus TaxID=33865 RepID=A0A9E7PLT1_9EURY|nr:MBL fold metallo-hydrolase [Methanoplanus endosymbiosus]UUX92528.1 MBL fold metallo-hydrolase [Methanoplanus endosymbiosus]